MPHNYNSIHPRRVDEHADQASGRAGSSFRVDNPVWRPVRDLRLPRQPQITSHSARAALRGGGLASGNSRAGALSGLEVVELLAMPLRLETAGGPRSGGDHDRVPGPPRPPAAADAAQVERRTRRPFLTLSLSPNRGPATGPSDQHSRGPNGPCGLTPTPRAREMIAWAESDLRISLARRCSTTLLLQRPDLSQPPRRLTGGSACFWVSRPTVMRFTRI